MLQILEVNEGIWVMDIDQKEKMMAKPWGTPCKGLERGGVISEGEKTRECGNPGVKDVKGCE